MQSIAFPKKMQTLERFSDRFEAFRLPAKGCDVLFAMYPAGTEIAPHTHDTDNWGVITRGEMLITVEGEERTYRTGDWYQIKSGIVHSARCTVDTEEIEFWFNADS